MSPAVSVEAADIASTLVLLGRRMQTYGAQIIQGQAHPAAALQLAAAMEQLAAALRAPIPEEDSPDPQLAAEAREAFDVAERRVIEG